MKEFEGLFGIDAVKYPRPANCWNFEVHCFTASLPSRKIFPQLGTNLSSEKQQKQ
jgi:hypothetical protein